MEQSAVHFCGGERLIILDRLNHHPVTHLRQIRAFGAVLLLEARLLGDLNINGRSLLRLDFKVFCIDGDDGAQYV
jgi:hypothetical protein